MTLLFGLIMPLSAFSHMHSEEYPGLTHVHESGGSQINWAKEELQYLNSLTELTYCIDPHWMPVEMNDNGKHVGLTADYIDIFRTHLPVPLRYVPSQTWPESLNMAKTRQCDILTAIETPERKEYLNFTQPLHKSNVILATEAHRPKVQKLSELSNAKVGIVRGYGYTHRLKIDFPNLIFVEVNNIREGLLKVISGDLYGFAGILTTVGYEIQQSHYGELKINGSFAHEWNFGLGVRNDHPLLVGIMDKLIDAISFSEQQTILNRWLSVSITEEQENELTISEKIFLEKNPVIKFRAKPNRPPFEFVEDGEVKGIAVDYIRKIAELTGFKAAFVVNDSTPIEGFSIMGQEASERLFDTILYSVYNKKRAEKLAYGDAYLSYPMMGFVRNNSPHFSGLNDLAGKTVALEKGFLTNQWLRRDYPKINIINTNTTYDALNLVEKGTADAYIGNLAIANYFFAHGELNDVKIGFPTKYRNIDYRFVTTINDEKLLSVLNKGYRQISPKEHNRLQQKWFSVQTIEKTDYTLVIQVAMVATLVVLGTLGWNRALSIEKSKTEQALLELRKVQSDLRDKNQLLQMLSVTDKLTGLYNRAKLETVLDQEYNRSERYKEHRFGVIIIDVDNFKLINDNFGHQTGDIFLVELSNLFLKSLRKVDVVGRWGGEEFLVIVPDTDRDGLITVAEHLRAIVEQTDFSLVGSRTSSFGAAMYQSDDSVESILIRADKALYQSKDSGRNRVTYL